jgi:hypothetical protein
MIPYNNLSSPAAGAGGVKPVSRQRQAMISASEIDGKQ